MEVGQFRGRQPFAPPAAGFFLCRIDVPVLVISRRSRLRAKACRRGEDPQTGSRAPELPRRRSTDCLGVAAQSGRALPDSLLSLLVFRLVPDGDTAVAGRCDRGSAVVLPTLAHRCL